MYSRIYILNCNIFKHQYFFQQKKYILKGAIGFFQPIYKKRNTRKEVKRKNLPLRAMSSHIGCSQNYINITKERKNRRDQIETSYTNFIAILVPIEIISKKTSQQYLKPKKAKTTHLYKKFPTTLVGSYHTNSKMIFRNTSTIYR